jgi:3-oxoadipate enol-lactonase
MKVRSDDAEIFYTVLGDGPDVVLLHAFPVNHRLWLPVAERLAVRYRVVLMDLRGHGESSTGEGPASMQKHAADILRVCHAAGVQKAVFGGVSIGGYVLFEFWRQSREQVRALILSDTRPQADTGEVRAGRLQAAEQVEKNGPDQFLDSLLPKLVGESTRRNRPDLVAAARAMMSQMTVAGIAAVQRGMAARPDSVSTLPTIQVPALLLFGEEDTLTPPAEAENMCRQMPRARVCVIPRAGHLAVFEQQDAAHEVLREFLDELPR